MYSFIELLKDRDIYKKKQFFKDSEFEEILKYVFGSMGKPNPGAGGGQGPAGGNQPQQPGPNINAYGGKNTPP